MITTIVHQDLSLEEVCRAQKNFSEVAMEIEESLRLPPYYQITLSISAEVSRNTYIAIPKFELFLVAQCEIVSFENGATFTSDKVVEMVVAYFKKKLRKKIN